MTGLRRLPAVTFRSAPPQPADVLPRMDIAAFVGFATRGPLHVPVPVEDVARFQAIFGPAPRLAWDPSAREWQTACLAGAVGDFFVQGGRRCWVVRVAGAHAATNRFPVAGLLQALPVGYAPVLARASSPGSWSDGLLVGASVQAQPLRVEIKGPLQPRHLTLLVGSLPGDEVRPGDTIHLDFGSQGELRAYLTASEVDWTQPEGGARRKQRIVGAAHWFERPAPGAYSGTVGRAGSDGPQMTGTLRLEGGAAWIETSVEELQVEPGDWLVFAQASYTPTFWLLAQQIESGLVRLRAAWREAGDLGAVLALQRAARVTMSLQARDDAQVNGRLDDLALSEPHPRYCGYIPDDAAIHRRPDGLPEPPARPPGAALQAEVERTRFPLAGPEDSAGVFIPLGLDVRPIWRGPQPQPGAALERDGLVPPGGEMDEHTWSDFVAELFLDPRLRLAAQSSLLAEAFDLRYMQHQELRGLHSMLPLEEASLLALPDAAHVGWRLVEAAATPLSRSPPVGVGN